MWDYNNPSTTGPNDCRKCSLPLSLQTGCGAVCTTSTYRPKIYSLARTCIRDTANSPMRYYNDLHKNRDDCSEYNPKSS